MLKMKDTYFKSLSDQSCKKDVGTGTAKYLHFLYAPIHMHTCVYSVEYSVQERQTHKYLCGVCTELWNLDENENQWFSDDTQKQFQSL